MIRESPNFESLKQAFIDSDLDLEIRQDKKLIKAKLNIDPAKKVQLATLLFDTKLRWKSSVITYVPTLSIRLGNSRITVHERLLIVNADFGGSFRQYVCEITKLQQDEIVRLLDLPKSKTSNDWGTRRHFVGSD